ncbi:MAG: hypothetical protein GY679_00075 [Mycoplasma sp.]|nr:hypothetical protein [Mycoplasma sp.]
MKNYQKTTATGESFSLLANDGIGVTVETISADTTLTAADSGKTLILSNATGEVITLPAVANISNGWNIKAKTGLAFATSDWTIVSATDVIEGYASVNYATVAAVNENTISFVATAETIGDWIEILFDGTSFIVYGVGNSTGSITFTVA